MNFITYNQLGKITGTGSCPDHLFELQAMNGDAIMEGEADWNTQYIANGVLVNKPPRPTGHHVFNYQSKVWEDPRSLDDLKLAQWEKVKQDRDAEEVGGFTWDGSVFDSDPVSQQRIQGAILQAQLLGPDFLIEWTLADNSSRVLSAQDIVQVGFALGTHVNLCHSKGRVLREQIHAATSPAQIAAVVWY